MKTKFSLLFVMLLSSLCITFTSCSDDDDDKTSDYAKEIAGTYKGDIFMAEAQVANDAIITITRIAENKVTLKMNQTILDLPITIECQSDVVPTYGTGIYENKEPLSISGTTTYQSLAVKVDGIIDRSGNATISIAIPDMSISVVYKGKKQ